MFEHAAPPSRPLALHPVGKRDRRWSLAVAVLGSTMAFLDGTVVNVALPVIQRDLDVAVDQVMWIVEAYSLLLASLVLVAASRSSATLTLTKTRVARQSGRGLHPPSVPWRVGGCSGTRRGGGSFFNVPVAVAVIAIALRRVAESRDDTSAGPIDFLGALLATAGLGLVVFALIDCDRAGRIGSAPVLSLLAIGAATLVLFVVVEGRRRSPMVPLSLFRSRTFSGTNLLTFLLYAALSGAFFFVPFNLIQVQRYGGRSGAAYATPWASKSTRFTGSTGERAALSRLRAIGKPRRCSSARSKKHALRSGMSRSCAGLPRRRGSSTTPFRKAKHGRAFRQSRAFAASSPVDRCSAEAVGSDVKPAPGLA